jgi:hypothetical protein
MTQKTTTRHRNAALPLALSSLFTFAVAGSIQTSVYAQSSSANNVTLVKVTDPVERSFTVQVPKGWRNQAYMVRTYDQIRPVVTSMSPDGKTLLFVGDPKLPGYFVPTPELNGNSEVARLNPNPLIKYEEYIPAQNYYPTYVREKFGKLPGFRLKGLVQDPALAQEMQQLMQSKGLQVQVEAVRLSFDYTDNGKAMHAIFNGITLSNGSIWMPNVCGVTTPGDPAAYNKLVMRVMKSHETDPQWKAREQQKHEQIMAKLRQDYENQKIAFNASNQRHELRMKSIQDAGNASMRSWYEKQAQSDASHRRFLNYITDENTVVDKSGKAYQVDNSHQKYFLNKRTNTYIGTKSTTNLSDLNRIPGVNANEYEEVKIKP